jgi:imidazolonepropionase-like amidohydrolase
MRNFTLQAIVASLLLFLASGVNRSTPSLPESDSATPQSSFSASATLVLRNVTIIDGNGGSPTSGMTLVILDGRIADIFADDKKKLPAGATVMDLSRQYVMPGLIDTHVHLQTEARPPQTMNAVLRFALLGGVTTVRDMGGNGPQLQRLREEANNGSITSPRIYFSAFITGPDSKFWLDDEKGRYVSNGMPPGTTAWFRRVAPGMDFARVISDAKAFGATGIKVHSGVPPALLKQLSLEARHQGLRVWGHAANTPSRPGENVAAGMEVLSHADMLAFEGVSDMSGLAAMKDYRVRALEAVRTVPVQSEAITRLLRQMKEKRVIFEPTLFIISAFVPNAPDEANRQRLQAQMEYAYRVTRRANDMGVMICAGTDAIGGSSPNLHSELQLLVDKAGLTPLQAITAATRNGARAIGIERDYGTIAKGKIADLVILRQNPADNIRNTQTIAYVLQAGKLYKRDQPLRTPPLAQPPPSN